MFDALVRRLSIGARIAATAIAFSLLLLLLFPLVGSSYNLTVEQIQALAQKEMPVSNLLLEASSLVASSELVVAQALADQQTNREALGYVDAALNRLQHVKLLYGPDASPLQNAALEEITLNTSTMRDALVAFDKRLGEGNLEAAGRQAAQVRASGDLARANIFDFVTDQRAALEARMNNVLGAWNNQFTALIALVGALFIVAVLFALWVARTITRPLNQMSESVESFVRGNTNALAPSRGSDEVTTLARTLNQLFTVQGQMSRVMTQEMEKRTVAVANRAIQLQTVAEITQDAATVADLEDLLVRVANLVRERFELYYVGVFLLDPEGRYAVMRAGSGEAGRVLKSRGFRLRVGEPNIVGQVTQSGEERVLNDVGADFTYLREAVLPLTRSEAVLPLKVGGQRIIGALDLQSALLNAFDPDTISILQILSGQLAVIIENSRLSAALADARQEAGTLLQRYTQESWSGQAALQRSPGYRFDLIEVQPFHAAGADPRLAAALADVPLEGSRVQVVPLENGGSLLRAPLTMYNQVVGVIGLEEEDPTRAWSEDEVKILEALTTQISLALENARLLDEAQRRTSQLRLLQEVTSAASAHTDLGALLDDVTRALRTALDLDFAGAAIFTALTPGFSPARARYGAASQSDSPFALLEAVNWQEHIPAVRALLEDRRSALVEVVRGGTELGTAAPVLEQAGVERVLLQPVLHRGQVVGLLDLYARSAGQLFTEENLRLLDQVALQIASAVEVALSFAQTAHRAERERQMAAVVQRIRETLDIPTILRTAAREIRTSLVAGAGGQQEAFQRTEVVVRLGGMAPLPAAPPAPHNDNGEGESQ